MLALTPADLRGLDADGLAALLGRRELVAAVGEGEVGGLAAAALLFADYAVLHDGATLHLDTAEAIAAAVWRVGRWRWQTAFTAAEARREGFCDEVVFEGRSELALDAAAGLIRSRGGDVLERAEFARLFATGEPREGLRAFLEKRRPDFRHSVGIVPPQENL
jgi:hypothetical protein